jgi:hypothetical protein
VDIEGEGVFACGDTMSEEEIGISQDGIGQWRRSVKRERRRRIGTYF